MTVEREGYIFNLYTNYSKLPAQFPNRLEEEGVEEGLFRMLDETGFKIKKSQINPLWFT